MENSGLTIVIPVYNEAATILIVLSELNQYLENHPIYLQGQRLNCEILCVNDASKDESGTILDQIAYIRVIHQPQNRGYGYALKTGIKAAKYNTILIMDSDGQHRPQDIPHLLNAYKGEYSMAIGKRKIHETQKKRVPGKLFLHNLVGYIFKSTIPDINSGFRIFNKYEAQKYFYLCSDRFSFTTSITIAYLVNDNELIYIPIEVRKRKEGTSQVNYKIGLNVIMKILELGMIFRPVRIIMPFFLFFSLLAFYSIVVDFYHFNITGTSYILFSTAILLFIVMMMSLQLGNIRIEILNHCDRKKNR